jgi:hypothetical protein
VFLDIIHRPVFYLKHTTFRRLYSVSVFRWNLLSWDQSIELVPISGHQHLSLMLRSTVSRLVCVGIKHHLGLTTRFLLLSDSCRFVNVRRSLRTRLSFTIAAGLRQRSHSRVRVALDSKPYLTVSDSRLPLSSPPTTRRATVDEFDPASTRDMSAPTQDGIYKPSTAQTICES